MYGSQTEYAMQKVPVLWVGLALITKSNKAVKKEREETKKNWLMHTHHAEYCRFSYLIFGKSVWYKIAFSAKLKLIQRHGSQITVERLKRHLGGKNSAVKGLTGTKIPFCGRGLFFHH